MMPTLDELHEADRRHAEALSEHDAAISELRATVKGQGEDIARHDTHLSKLDETCTLLREKFGTLATRADMDRLTDAVNTRHNEQMLRAQESTPRAVSMFMGAVTLICTVVATAAIFWHH